MERDNSYEYINDRIKGHDRGEIIFFLMACGGAIFNAPITAVCGGIGSIYHSINSIRQNHNIKECDEYKDLRNYYKAIRKEVLSCSYDLGMDNIESLFTYISYLNKNGYLDYRRSTDLEINKPFRKQDSILKELSLNNHGESVSKSIMLADYLNHSKLVAPATVIKGRYYDAKEIELLSGEINIDECEREIGGLEEKNNLPHNNRALLEYLLLTNQIKINTKMKEKDANLTITIASSNRNSYYLDITNGIIYSKTDINDDILLSANEIFVINPQTTWSYDIPYEAYLESIRRLQEPVQSDVSRRVEETKMLIEDNIAIIEDLYSIIRPNLLEAEDAYQRILKSS